MDIVLQQLQYENSAFCIHLLLTTILDKAIKSEVVSKAAKKALLSKKGVLASIAGLFEWNGMMDISADQVPVLLVLTSSLILSCWLVKTALCSSVDESILLQILLLNSQSILIKDYKIGIFCMPIHKIVFFLYLQ